MGKRHYLWALFLSLNAFHLQAQWDDPPGQYWVIRSYYNPSFSGDSEAISMSALYQYKWNGLENAPRQFILTAGMPFEFHGQQHAAGLVVNNETIGQLRNSLLALQYSFNKQIGTGLLRIGFQAGVYDLNFDANNIRVLADTMQTGRKILKANTIDRQVLNIGTGISWTGKYAFIGASATHLNQPRFYTRKESSNDDIPNDSVRSSIPRFYNLMAGYNINPFHSLEIQPMLWIQTNFSSETQVQATLRLLYNKKASFGVSWRKDDGYLFFAGASLGKVDMGYAFFHHTIGVGQKSRGSHELYLRYDLPLDHFMPKKNPHKSIRLL